MRRVNLIRNIRQPDDDAIDDWLSGVRTPRPLSPDEILHAARNLGIQRPLLPVISVASLVGICILLISAWPLMRPEAMIWSAIGSGLAIFAIITSVVWDHVFRLSPANSARAIALGAIVLGAQWASAPVIFTDSIAGSLAMASLIVCVVGFSPIPIAQIGFITAFACISLIANIDGAHFVAMIAAAFLGVPIAYVAARQHFSAVNSVHKKAEGHARIAHRAETFEKNGNGWFWETDAHGRLTYASPKFTDAIDSEEQDILGHPLTDLAALDAELDDNSNSDMRALSFHLQARLAFSDVLLPVRVRDKIHWWSLSGHPTYDQFEKFVGFSGIGTDLTEVRNSEDKMAHMARFDPLTGLANRSTIRETLAKTLEQVKHDHTKVALFLLDLDRFKTVNDTLGHQIGDVLLEQVAERLDTLIGSDGRVGRLGGDEFAIVLSNASQREHLETLAKRIIEYLSAPYTVSSHRVVIGATIGIAIGPDDGHTVDAVLRNADLALYAAKGRGRGRHCFYEDDMHSAADARRLMEVDLRSALKNDGLSLYFQPIVDAGSEMLVGFEALARWYHPKYGEISPTKFIPLAEETGIIEQIGEWVIRSACAAAAQWPDHLRIAVNLSPLQFANPNLSSLVVNAIAQSQLPASRLELEVTEGIFLQENDTTKATLRQLDTLGVKLTLDDFGTGYSSLGYLLKAPFGKIKIDRSFVSGAAAKDGQKAAIVKAIVALANSLDMLTTAEGAETHDDLDTIRELGCSQVQGYIYSKPLSAEAALALAQKKTPLTAQGHKTNRAHRSVMLRSVEIYYENSRRKAKLRNISGTGAMFEADWKAEPGLHVEIFIDREPSRKGTIRWTNESRFGVLFDDHIEVPVGHMAPKATPERLSSAA